MESTADSDQDSGQFLEPHEDDGAIVRATPDGPPVVPRVDQGYLDSPGRITTAIMAYPSSRTAEGRASLIILNMLVMPVDPVNFC